MFLLMMGLSDFFFFHRVNWEKISSFVVRNAVNQGATKSPDETMYHRVFVSFWLWAVLVLTYAYAGKRHT